MKIGVYPGSFDPFTIGHLEVLKSAAGLFDIVYVAVLNNTAKSPVFGVEERMEMIRRVIETEAFENVRAGSFNGLLVDYAQSIDAQYIIRGLRAITDFEYEFQIDAVNRHLKPEIRTVYFMATPAHSFLSSSSVREIGEWGGSIEGLVPHCNTDYIRERLARQK